MPLIILRICLMSTHPLGKVYNLSNHTKDCSPKNSQENIHIQGIQCLWTFPLESNT